MDGLEGVWGPRWSGTASTGSGRAEVFSIDTPPPTVSGSLHVGTGRVHNHFGARCAPLLPYDPALVPPEPVGGKGKRPVLKSRRNLVSLCERLTDQAFEELWRRVGAQRVPAFCAW